MTQHLTWTRYGILILGAMLWLGACGDEDDDGDGGNSDAPAVNCQSRCEQRLAECDVPAAAATQGCQNDVCNFSPTEAQLSCAEASTCEEILTVSNLCGIGLDDDNNADCPELSCDCDGVPITGQIEVNGECAEDCDTACEALQGG